MASNAAAQAAKAAGKAATATVKAVKGTHGFVQKKLFEGEAPTLYRLKGNKYSHCYGAQKRDEQNMQWLAPYLASGVLAGMFLAFVVVPISFQRNYSATKKQYEAFARQNEEMLTNQFDRGQFSKSELYKKKEF
eukprot:TRINITY_DN80544_c0_g1_i1.p1 TRINITY_DN80544_c0_g1~~TRINITY_DN80544_c0_g1_i1.p1  ORF type:complete len:149 (+),score=35.87 TRINITY_DN80544_c0_g1_i1:48-449(+)